MHILIRIQYYSSGFQSYTIIHYSVINILVYKSFDLVILLLCL